MNKNEKYLYLKEIVQYDQPIKELITYTENKFTVKKKNKLTGSNLSVDTWELYFKEAKESGVYETLKKYLIQLQFPIQKGISKSENYINCTLKGKKNHAASNLVLNRPESLELMIHESPLIGKIPVIIIPDDEDFNSFVSALSNKNEPATLPKSMGAALINGINNWDRIERLKSKWLKDNFAGNWVLEFKKNIFPQPHLYKDRLIILSTKPYSGVNYNLLGESKTDWKEKSLQIRLQHECSHLFTLKNYGCMANNIHDEIIADYVGIVDVLSVFNKNWLLSFFGLENYPKYRNGGRLENYLDQNNMSEIAFDGLKTIIKKTVDNISKFDKLLGEINSTKDQIKRIESICEVDLVTMSSSNGANELLNKYHTK
jgi:hypothetical protein